MNLDRERVTRHLRAFDFTPLFIEELGWDHYTTPLEVEVNGQLFSLQAIAEKRGVVALHCPLSGDFPPYATRRKIDRQVARSYREHLILYTNGARTEQIWQWVRQEVGRPLASREHRYHVQQSGEALFQKLETIAFSLEEEEALTLVEVTGRLRAAFNVERATKRFYDRFKREREAFQSFLSGIPQGEMELWYVSVMLNRLMFIYFIQKKGFLDNDPDYLRHKLAQSQAQAQDRFYRDFLCPLFFEGFARSAQERSASTQTLLGQVPYLNGSIFQQHEVERIHGRDIQIADAAFERLFGFFEQYQWHLDDRPLRDDREINPDVLGYIFEKYINQKQMGAYYTKEDITGYISRNTILPFLLEQSHRQCRGAFEQTTWPLLVDDPDRYIYPTVRHGTEHPLPPDIAVGIDDVSRRELWNTPSPDPYALPTEIWRETVARRQRCEELWRKLAAGEVHEANDLITYNLDIEQFAQDVIENCEDPALLRAFWKALNEITVLDPTCGSGAFLFAALNILEPLYEACLERMAAFVDELVTGEHHPRKYQDFRDILDQLDRHPNRRYFILKSIVVNNLYGVDIMDEAVEIAKLRLFLKLVAQVDRVEDIEPLPDIDFNIRAGNTLVGFATRQELERALRQKGLQAKMLFPEDQSIVEQIEEKAADVDRLYEQFRAMQIDHDMRAYARDFAETKRELHERLRALEDELNQYLAREYGVDPRKKKAYQRWLSSHQPFHWFVEFYGIIRNGGFDIIIGNPPYLEQRQINYRPLRLTTNTSRAIHAMCIEASAQLLHKKGCMSMIVPLAVVSTQRMEVVQQILEELGSVWYANFSWRPGKLFDTVNRALTIFIVTPSMRQPQTFSTDYQKWTTDSRGLLMQQIKFTEVPRNRPTFWVPKTGNGIEISLLERLLSIPTLSNSFMRDSKHHVYYRSDGGLYWKVFTDFSPSFKINGNPGKSTRERTFSMQTPNAVKNIIATLSSSLFWWWYTITSNCRHLNPYDIQHFPIPQSAFLDNAIAQLAEEYLEDIQRNSSMLVRQQKQTGTTETQSFKISKSKPIIDKIDRALASHYGLTDEELDFIINYDIKYRMSDELFEDEAEGEEDE